MFTKSKHIALPRRIVAYYLLFGVSAIAWLTAGIFYVSNSVLQSRGDSRAFTVLGQASRVLALDYLQHGEASLQPLVEELTREQGLAYCAVVNSDGTCLAHSNTSMVQKKAPEPAGAAEIWGDIQRVRFVNDDSVVILEYRTPFNAGGRSVGSVRIGTVETGTFQTLKLAAGYAPLAILAPLALMAGGAVVVSRLVRPVSEIEGQLRRAAVAPSM